MVLLEAGKRHEVSDFVNDEWDSFAQLAWVDPRTTSGTWRVAKDFPTVPAWIFKTVGGSTVHWAGASLRFQAHEFKARTTYGASRARSCSTGRYARGNGAVVHRAENKHGGHGNQWHSRLPGNNNFKVFAPARRKIGYKECIPGNMAINSRPRDGRAVCLQIGFCFQGCRTDAKWSTLYTEIPTGEETGKLDVRPESHGGADRAQRRGQGDRRRVSRSAGKQQRQKARVVMVAGNSIESPRFLLNSRLGEVPGGLANCSGQVGKNYMRHMTGSRVRGVQRRPVNMYRGTTMAGHHAG